MNLTSQNIEFIETSLTFYDIKDAELRDDLIDHICTFIEQYDGDDFESAYQKAIVNLGGYAALQLIQKDKDEKQLIKRFLKRKKAFYLESSFNMMILALGFLFKLNHWPFANILMGIGFAMLIFVTIPFAFYNRYKLSAQKLRLTNN